MNLLKIIALLFCFLFSSSAVAFGGGSGRNAIILQPGNNEVFGSYIFAARNSGSEPVEYRAEIALPKEMTDFKVESGIKPEEITLGENGALVIKTLLKPGMTYINISFVVPAFFGSADLTFEIATEINEFAVLLPKNSIKLNSNDFEPDINTSGMMTGRYETSLSKAPLLKGQTVSMEITGVPEGRTRLWYSGLAFGLALFMAGAIMSVVTLPGRRRANV